MPSPNKIFGRLLTMAVNGIAIYEGKNAAMVEDELGEQSGVAATTIQRYKSGHVPPDPHTVALLAEAGVKRGRLSREWLQEFLYTTLYPAPEKLMDHLSPPTPTQPRPPRVLENLPAPPYSQFIMREEAFAEVVDGLQQRSAIVLIVGLGGSGKTSLARELAWCCLTNRGDAPRFDAVVWVTDKDRPRTTNLSIVLDIIARTLDYPGFIQLSHEEKLYEIGQLLRRFATLLILDNFETITDGALLTWLLRLPEPSKALITTREYRREFKRACWPIELRGMSEIEARTFVEQRARMLKLEKHLTDHTQLSDMLDITGGNPKALELALGVLKYGHKALRQVIDDLHRARGEIFDDLFAHSWELLEEPARHVLLSTPLFATSASSEALALTANVRGFAFDRAVEQLTNFSLLDVQTSDLDGTPRYLLHPLVRVFASAQLVEQPEWERATRERWSCFFLEYVEQYGDDDLGGEIGDGKPGHRERLQTEITNLRQVIDWCFKEQQDRAIRLVERITTFLLDEGHWHERLDLCTRALAIAFERGSTANQAGLLARLGWTYLVQGAFAQAREAMDQARAIAEHHGLSNRLVQILRDTGFLYSKLGEYEQADQYCASSLDLALRLGDQLGVIEARFFAARIAYFRGSFDEAKRALLALHSECKAKYPRQGIPMLRFLGNIAIAEREYERARACLDEAFAVVALYAEEHEVAQLYQSLGMLELSLGNLTVARDAHQQAMQQMIRLGMRHELAEVRALWTEVGADPL